jgi:hypothetical protein
MVEGELGFIRSAGERWGEVWWRLKRRVTWLIVRRKVSTWQSTWDGMLLASWPALVGAQASHAVAAFGTFWSPAWVACVFWEKKLKVLSYQSCCLDDRCRREGIIIYECTAHPSNMQT